VDTLYRDVAELQAEVDAGSVDPHAKVAAVLFGPEFTPRQRTDAKYLNMVACLHLSTEAAADLFQAPRERVIEMLERYRRLVLA
jgi:hypothetical protein